MSQKNSQTNTSSAKPAEDEPTGQQSGVPEGTHQIYWPIPPNMESATTVNMKCTPCATVTSHVALPLHVANDPNFATDPTATMMLARRMLLCQNCGNMRLVK